MIFVYTGNGKGKTTAAVGQIIRALGHKKRACLIQLFKGKEYYGEQKILKKLKDLDFFSFAPYHPLCAKSTERTFVRGEHLFALESVKKQCAKSLDCLEKVLKEKKYALIVLDEFNIALRDKFMKSEKLIDIIRTKAGKSDIIITGRGAPKSLLKIATLITEFREIKHPFQNGISAKKGIEY